MWIPDEALRRLEQEAARARPLETGGVLVGYRADNSYVITDVIGPGPGALHRRERFVPDSTWQFEQLDLAFAASPSTRRYVGDWHTHPESPAQLSWIDRRTLARIARGKATGERNPLMMIGSGLGGANGWSWIAHVHVRTVGRLWSSTTEAELSGTNVNTPPLP